MWEYDTGELGIINGTWEIYKTEILLDALGGYIQSDMDRLMNATSGMTCDLWER